MLNWFLGFILLISMVSGFNYSYKLTGIERTFLSLSGGVIESGLINMEHTSNNIYFYKPKLEANVKTYLSEELSRYCDTYQISFYYFDAETLEPCLNSCTGVQIRLVINLSPFPNYDQTYNYTINKGN